MDSKWDHRFMELAKHIAQWSSDDSTKVGVVVVGPDKEIRATGYNGFPRGVDYTPERRERPAKYAFTAHAEANAVYNAARIGVSLKGCTMYLSTLLPCAQCAQAIRQAGIKELVANLTHIPERWKESIDAGLEILRAPGDNYVEVVAHVEQEHI